MNQENLPEEQVLNSKKIDDISQKSEVSILEAKLTKNADKVEKEGVPKKLEQESMVQKFIAILKAKFLPVLIICFMGVLSFWIGWALYTHFSHGQGTSSTSNQQHSTTLENKSKKNKEQDKGKNE
ncbi:hypothetical protein [Lactococcus lactis]|uniref:hypothetical protein n=1 Tax=Lactococcus lactis TaxID=1358 RepID=UPI0022E093F6|nr:hypothetical protein [Lactococcus lactis]